MRGMSICGNVRVLWLSFLLLAAAGCGKGDVGDACDAAGKQDECVDGAICTNEGEGATCRALCNEAEDCAPGEACNGVSNTNLKSCQPDK